MSEPETPQTYILAPGPIVAKALSATLGSILPDASYAIGTNIEEALNGTYRRVIDCRPKFGEEKRIEVVNAKMTSLMDIIEALQE